MTIEELKKTRTQAWIKYKLSCENDMGAFIRLQELDRQLEEAKRKATAARV